MTYHTIMCNIFERGNEVQNLLVVWYKNGLKIIACPSTATQFNDERRIGFNYYTLFDDGRLDYETQWINS
jgi:Icc protein